VAQVAAGQLDAGSHTVLWNALGTTGTRVPAGTYVVQVVAQAGDGSRTTAMAVLKLLR
jgi:flagellar hook assembly protein FlgD